MKIEKTFGEIIKKLREAQGMPLREVAEALGIDTSMLGKIEKANRKPSKAFIEKCAEFFGVKEGELMIAFLSDTVAYQIKDEEDAIQVLKVAEEKIKYLRSNKKP